jgi:hypothetical protein
MKYVTRSRDSMSRRENSARSRLVFGANPDNQFFLRSNDSPKQCDLLAFGDGRLSCVDLGPLRRTIGCAHDELVVVPSTVLRHATVFVTRRFRSELCEEPMASPVNAWRYRAERWSMRVLLIPAMAVGCWFLKGLDRFIGATGEGPERDSAIRSLTRAGPPLCGRCTRAESGRRGHQATLVVEARSFPPPRLCQFHPSRRTPDRRSDSTGEWSRR